MIGVFVDELDLAALGFAGVVPEATGRPAYHPGLLLKTYVYGYINQIASSRRLEREAQRNIEMMWLTHRLAPDFKTIADFRKDNGPAIRATCRQFVVLCRKMELFAYALAAIDGSKFKAANTRDKNFTRASIKRRMEQVEASIARYRRASGPAAGGRSMTSRSPPRRIKASWPSHSNSRQGHFRAWPLRPPSARKPSAARLVEPRPRYPTWRWRVSAASAGHWRGRSYRQT